MADPIPHVVAASGDASAAPDGAIPVALYGAGSSGPTTVTSDDITDATATGKSVLTAASAAAARTAIGAGTSNLALGTTASTALAGNTALLQIGTTATTAAAGNHTQAATTVNVSADATNGVTAGNLQATISALAARIKALEDAAA